MHTDAAVSVRSLNVWYGPFHAVKDVSLDMPKNRIIALIGASGSGKSTFLRTINRMLDTVPAARTSGQILVNGSDVLHESADVIELRRRVGMVFQNPTPFPTSIYHNVSYGLEIQGVRPPRSRGWRRFFPGPRRSSEVAESSHPMDQTVVRSLKEASLWEEVKERLYLSAYRLSGGQQQRLCIARSIAVLPDILLLDEPCSQLDPISTRHIEELLLTLKPRYTIVIVTHNMHQARRVSDFTGFFHAGKLVEFGPTAEIFDNAKESLTREYVRGEFG